LHYTLSDIAHICNGTLHGINHPVHAVVVDSRKYIGQRNACFFALHGPHRSGDAFIKDVNDAGVLAFVSSALPQNLDLLVAGVVLVSDPLVALQKLAAHHRAQFTGTVVAVTGSYGKTIVKEWLYHMLSAKHRVFRSPKSWNSQLGVPLSLLLLNQDYDVAIIEAGISKPGEMGKLEPIIRPEIGIFTNCGQAHAENFSSLLQKASEKALLFANASMVVADQGEADVIDALAQLPCTKVALGERISEPDGCRLQLLASGAAHQFFIPFNDSASVQNAMLVAATALHMGLDEQTLAQRMVGLPVVALRQELIPGRFGSLLINDAWHADPSGLGIVLQMAKQVAANMPVALILSDIHAEGIGRERLYRQMQDVIALHGVSRLYLIGHEIQQHFDANTVRGCFTDTDAAIAGLAAEWLAGHCVIIRGARKFQLERLVAVLAERSHKTRLEINMSSIQRNLSAQRNVVGPNVKIMAMLKAFAYGVGADELARVLSQNIVDYVGVAFAHEGIQLRKAGLQLPVMVMDTNALVFDEVIRYQLEPVIFGHRMLNEFLHYLIRQGIQGYPIHIELNTGMNRLGFDVDELQQLCDTLIAQPEVRVVSVFSHLAAADNPQHDAFTHQQIEVFAQAAEIIANRLDYPFMRHILNTHGIARFAQASFDMVRTGIGLYTGEQSTVKLITTVTQLRHIKSGESVGYNRAWVAQRDTTVATLPIGYADGFKRLLSNGVGTVSIRGERFYVIGNICMDLTMIDVTGSNVKEGDEVEIFGDTISLAEFADKCNTIQYEVMTSVSGRVSRIYLWE